MKHVTTLEKKSMRTSSKAARARHIAENNPGISVEDFETIAKKAGWSDIKPATFYKAVSQIRQSANKKTKQTTTVSNDTVATVENDDEVLAVSVEAVQEMAEMIRRHGLEEVELTYNTCREIVKATAETQ